MCVFRWQAKPLETLNITYAKGPIYEGLLTEMWRWHLKWQKNNNTGNNGGLKANQDNKQQTCSSSYPHQRIISHSIHNQDTRHMINVTNSSCHNLHFIYTSWQIKQHITEKCHTSKRRYDFFFVSFLFLSSPHFFWNIDMSIICRYLVPLRLLSCHFDVMKKKKRESSQFILEQYKSMQLQNVFFFIFGVFFGWLNALRYLKMSQTIPQKSTDNENNI